MATMLSEHGENSNRITVTKDFHDHSKITVQRDEGYSASSRASTAQTKVISRMTPRNGSDANSSRSNGILEAQEPQRPESPATQRSAALSHLSSHSRQPSEKHSLYSTSSKRSQLQEIISEQLSSVSEENSRLDAIEKMIASWSMSLQSRRKGRATEISSPDKDPKADSSSPKKSGDAKEWGAHQVENSTKQKPLVQSIAAAGNTTSFM